MKKGKKVPRRRRTVEQKHMPGFKHKVLSKYNRREKHKGPIEDA